MKKQYYFFDVCGTITKTNNTYSFIYFVIQKNLKLKIKFIIYLIEGYILKIINTNDNRSRLKIVNLLNGFKINELKKEAKKYVSLLERKHLFNSEVIDEINKYKESVILISSAIDFPICAIAKKLGIKQYISSTLKSKNEIILGNFEKDILSKKHEVLESIKDIDYSKSYFYSDNFEDLKSLKKFKHQIIIINNKNNIKIWKNKLPKCTIIIPSLEEKPYPTNINKKNHNLGYIPSIYYILSRLKEGVVYSLLIKEILPISLINTYINKVNFIKSFSITIFVYIIFYSIYEIGNLYNDQIDKNKKTIRIPDGIYYNFLLFITIRISFLIIIFLFFQANNIINILQFYSVSLATLVVLIFHSLIKKEKRICTFILLRLLKAIIPIFTIIGTNNIIPNTIALITYQHLNSIFFYYNKHFFDSIKNWMTFHLAMVAVCLIISIVTNNAIYLIIMTAITVINFLKFFINSNQNRNII